MPKPRKALVSLDVTSYYHCVSRCVRRAFLCGEDVQSGNCYEHRRQWIERRMKSLAAVFAIDVCAYAVMSNHYHVVLHVDRSQAAGWHETEVIRRWQQLFLGHPLAQRYLAGETLLQTELEAVHELVALWRNRLSDISWYMRCLNESIARRANEEDQCTGRFWEGRFKCQALLDDKALVACLAYVDLNAVRAGTAETPETSQHTSVRDRIRATLSAIPTQPAHLLPFVGSPRQEMSKGLPFRLEDYLELVDWTGRILREDKPGAIPATLPPILERLRIDPRHWVYMTRNFESRFKGLVGAVYQLKAACETLGYRRTPNLAVCRELLS